MKISIPRILIVFFMLFPFIFIAPNQTISLSAEEYLNHAQQLKAQGNINEAIETFKKAIMMQPDYSEAYFHCGIVLRMQKRYSEAIEYFEQVIYLDPCYTEAYNYLEDTLQELKSFTDIHNKEIECGINTFRDPKENTSWVAAEIAPGELLDKITILETKIEHIQEPEKLENVKIELKILNETFENLKATIFEESLTEEVIKEYISFLDNLGKLIKELLEINKKLWDIEDAIREKEHRQEFDQEFIELARSVYFTNDERYRIKRAINTLLGSRIIEEKSYKEY